ncbi:MAG: DUF1365 domain-containing protein [Alphaproteobacteria bacterium]
MGIAPQAVWDSPKLLRAKVMHKRMRPKVNEFHYGVYYLCLPLNWLEQQTRNDAQEQDIMLPLNRFGLLSFHVKDHGHRDGSSLNEWAMTQLAAHDIGGVQSIILIAMPRIFGYGFNPVSFYLCHDENANLRAVILEVNNTFNETHSYICALPDGKNITADHMLKAAKLFHVSPFLPRTGEYHMRFDVNDTLFKAIIDYDDHQQAGLMLKTLLQGKFEPLTKQSLRRAFWQHKLLSLKVILLIHYQAFKLLFKKARYIKKPVQLSEKTSCNHQDQA